MKTFLLPGALFLLTLSFAGGAMTEMYMGKPQQLGGPSQIQPTDADVSITITPDSKTNVGDLHVDIHDNVKQYNYSTSLNQLKRQVDVTVAQDSQYQQQQADLLGVQLKVQAEIDKLGLKDPIASTTP